MKTLVAHDLGKEFFGQDLSGYTVTLDDGLYSHYYYLPLTRKASWRTVYCLATHFIRPGPRRKQFQGDFLETTPPKKYMFAAVVDNDFRHFMTVEEARHLAAEQAVFAAHSHFHDVVYVNEPPKKRTYPWKIRRYNDFSPDLPTNWSLRSRLAFQGYGVQEGRFIPRTYKEWLDDIRADTQACLDWFERNLGITPKAYAFPFNEYCEELVHILRSFGFTTFYAKTAGMPGVIDRMPIEAVVKQVGSRQ